MIAYIVVFVSYFDYSTFLFIFFNCFYQELEYNIVHNTVISFISAQYIN